VCVCARGLVSCVQSAGVFNVVYVYVYVYAYGYVISKPGRGKFVLQYTGKHHIMSHRFICPILKKITDGGC